MVFRILELWFKGEERDYFRFRFKSLIYIKRYRWICKCIYSLKYIIIYRYFYYIFIKFYDKAIEVDIELRF